MYDSDEPGCLFAMLLIVALSVFCVYQYAHDTTYDEHIEIVSLTWQRLQAVEMIKLFHESNSSTFWYPGVPDGGYNKSSWTTTDTWTTEECSGTGKNRSCETEWHSETRYHTAWDINRWAFDHNLETTGTPHNERVWPDFAPVGDGVALGSTRAGGRTENFYVNFKSVDRKRTRQLVLSDYHTWREYGLEQHFSVKVNRLEQVWWDTLKEE